MAEFATAPIYERIEILEEALAKALDIDLSMSVESSGPGCLDRCVWVLERPYSDTRVGHDLSKIARELERLLS